MSGKRSVIWLLMLILCALAGCQNQQPESNSAPLPESRHFAETGFLVRGEFLRFFYVYGGEASLGRPLTNEVVVDGWRAQYFEKGRLEYHPENELAYRVTVGWLGDLLNRRRPPISTGQIPRADDRNTRYFPQTGHTLSGDFLRYFDSHGGSVRFGRPISEPFLLNGQLTQDFQSARFFWTPLAPQPVTLEDTGRVHLDSLQKK